MSLHVSIWWVRLDLRLADNPALLAAVADGRAVVPVYIGSPEDEAPWAPGGASRWWLHQSLCSLDAQLRTVGSRLIIRHGPAEAALRQLAEETGARRVYWNRRYEPALIARDRRLQEALRAEGLEAESFNAALLHEPWTIQNKSRRPFQVFTPFWRHCLSQPDPQAPLIAPRQIVAPATWPRSLELSELQLEPRLRWADSFRAVWTPGEAGAMAALNNFLGHAFTDYAEQRNRPDVAGTSRLSPHLHFGDISPRQVWHRLKTTVGQRGSSPEVWRGSQFLAEIGWREFAHHLLFHFPTRPISRCVANLSDSLGGQTPICCGPGNAGAPVSRSLMPECESCGRPGGCTTACA